jgi:hypothetical protein
VARDRDTGSEPNGENTADMAAIIPIQRAESRILLIRDQRVILDSDLAELYGVTTKRLNEQVRRNIGRFPPDFMFQLTESEKLEVVANCDHLQRLKFSPVLPYAFTEHGAIMAAGVLKSERAIQTSIFVVRAFVRLKQALASHDDLAAKVKRLQKTVQNHDKQIVAIVDTIQLLMPPPQDPPKEPFGFRRARRN